jgi:hypothetical protein
MRRILVVLALGGVTATAVVLIAWATGADFFGAPSYFTTAEENPPESAGTLTVDLGPAVAKELITAHGWGNGTRIDSIGARIPC